jgi:hypothetical protein
VALAAPLAAAVGATLSMVTAWVPSTVLPSSSVVLTVSRCRAVGVGVGEAAGGGGSAVRAVLRPSPQAMV